MPRFIPYPLLQDIQRECTTLCVLIRFDPVQPGFSPYGVTGLDQDVTYDDGTGPLEYSAPVGAELSTIIATADLSVDGGNNSSLLPVFDTPISEADIVAGAYDFATFTCYLVNYKALDKGHVVIGYGTTGRNTITDGGLSVLQEMRGLAQALKQSLTEKWSLGCRATFGSQPGGVDRYPCNFDADALWEAGVVDSVGLETNRTFVTSGLNPPYGGEPGMVRWTSGANTGRQYEVESFEDVAGVITIDLTFPTMFPITAADTFDFRDDCPKTEQACKDRDNYENYRGEPKIPVSDAGQIAAPGASAGVGTGATVTTDYPDPA
jgi:uncharacterized phage protein (TIGR02218 family)